MTWGRGWGMKGSIYRMNKIKKQVVLYFLLVALSVAILFPFVVMISTSLKSLNEIRVSPYKILPEVFRFDNYRAFFQSGNWALYFYNSAVVASVTTVVSILTNAIAGYAFARLHFYGKDFLFRFALIGMMVPMQTVMIPIYLKVKTIPLAGGNNLLGQGGIGMLNTTWGVIAPLLAGAFGLFLCKQFFESFPISLDEAAKIDGCSNSRLFFTIYIPLSKPILATLAILKFTDGWNQYTWPLIITNSDKGRTVQLALAMFRGSSVVKWDLLMAGTIVTCIPVLILFLALQKYYVQGIVTDGIKG